MDEANGRISLLKRRIDDQIELVAALICEQKCADGAVRLLDALTQALVCEEHRRNQMP